MLPLLLTIPWSLEHFTISGGADRQYVVCKNHNGTIVGIYGDSDDCSCDFFNFQITLKNGIVTTTLLDETTGYDESINETILSLNCEYKSSRDIDIRTDFPIFDFIRYKIEELGMEEIPNSGNDISLGLNNTNTEINENALSIEGYVFLDTEYQSIFEDLLGVTTSDFSGKKSKKKKSKKIKEVDHPKGVIESIEHTEKTVDQMLKEIRKRRIQTNHQIELSPCNLRTSP
ncbi:MAG TPA: hypothetical protein ACQGQF_01465 [Xylella fastidiosa subsp. pauca]